MHTSRMHTNRGSSHLGSGCGSGCLVFVGIWSAAACLVCGGGCLVWRDLPLSGRSSGRRHPLCEQTDACENITFPILRMRSVKSLTPGHLSRAQSCAYSMRLCCQSEIQHNYQIFIFVQQIVNLVFSSYQ